MKARVFAWEYKGKHKDLAAAYAQLVYYREDLENRRCWWSATRSGSRSIPISPAQKRQIYGFRLDDMLSTVPKEAMARDEICDKLHVF